jgi:hypothetical protein
MISRTFNGNAQLTTVPAPPRQISARFARLRCHGHGFGWACFGEHMATQSSGHGTQTSGATFSSFSHKWRDTIFPFTFRQEHVLPAVRLKALLLAPAMPACWHNRRKDAPAGGTADPAPLMPDALDAGITPAEGSLATAIDAGVANVDAGPAFPLESAAVVGAALAVAWERHDRALQAEARELRRRRAKKASKPNWRGRSACLKTVEGHPY